MVAEKAPHNSLVLGRLSASATAATESLVGDSRPSDRARALTLDIVPSYTARDAFNDSASSHGTLLRAIAAVRTLWQHAE